MTLRAKTFDLVITDILMPRMGGIDFIHHIKASGDRVKILVISGGGGQNPDAFNRRIASPPNCFRRWMPC